MITTYVIHHCCDVHYIIFTVYDSCYGSKAISIDLMVGKAHTCIDRAVASAHNHPFVKWQLYVYNETLRGSFHLGYCSQWSVFTVK